MNSDSKLLQVNNLVVRYYVDKETVCAVNGVSFSLNSGETLALVGETGAGKTTTALAILGLVPNPPGVITDGEILFEGENLLNLSVKQMRKIRGNAITMIFQDPMTSLNPVMTVGYQIEEVIKLHYPGLSASEAEAKAVEMLEMVGISADRFNEYPHQFSGGMRQRVMIAIALACNPRLLIADEPTTALDVTIQAQVLELMNQLKKDLGTSIILITHDLGVVSETADTVAIIYAGEIVEYGSFDEVFNQPAHPYTRGLFHSIPSINKDSKRLATIPGMMPDPSCLPEGCKFHPRCQDCTELCKTQSPGCIQLSESHKVWCHLAAQV